MCPLWSLPSILSHLPNCNRCFRANLYLKYTSQDYIVIQDSITDHIIYMDLRKMVGRKLVVTKIGKYEI